jgi:hypothetical protein
VSPLDAANLSWEQVLDLVGETVAQGAGLRLSPYLVDHTGNTPSHLIDSTFSLEDQIANDDAYRDLTEMRLAHTLTITFLKKLNAHDQAADQKDALRTAQRIVRALNDAVALGELRVSFRGAVPSLTADRTFLATRLTFRLVHDWYAQPLGGA